MTQSLSSLMSEGATLALVMVGLILLLGFFWRWYRQRLAQKHSLPEGENHPAISTRFYKLSELKKECADLSGKELGTLRMRSMSSNDVHPIPPDLWDV